MSNTIPFVPSHSAIQQFKDCPRRYQAQYVSKEISYQPSAPADLGKCLHKLAEWFVLQKLERPIPPGADTVSDRELTTDTYKEACIAVRPKFPPTLYELAEHWRHIRPVLDGLPFNPHTRIMVEHKVAFNYQGVGCDYFDRDGVFRAIIDLAAITGNMAVLIDYKTSKEMKASAQLQRSALAMFMAHPNLQVVYTNFVSTRGQPSIRERYLRNDMEDMLAKLMTDIRSVQEAYVTNTWPEKKSGLCRSWCPVEKCTNFGGGANVL